MTVWDSLDEPWRAAFELAWEAYGAGTIPVGAVVVDAGGAIVARGRNRVFERNAPPGQIAGSRVAHAEINALVELGLERRYRDHVLYTTLEPCTQCVGAAWVSTIGTVRYAAADVYAGAACLIDVQIEIGDVARRDPMAVEGPLDSPLATLSELLHADFFRRRAQEHVVWEAYRELRPEITALAERVPLRELAGAPLAEALPVLLESL